MSVLMIPKRKAQPKTSTLKRKAVTKWLTRKPSKYKNKFAEVGNTIYDSKFEARVAEQLEWRKLAGEITQIDKQYCLRLDVNGEHICKYYVDFRIVLADGSEQFVEAKGFETDVWRLKWKMALAIYGKEKFVLIKKNS